MAKKARQRFLEGMEPPRHKDLDAAAEIYYDRMTERVALSKEEDEAKDSLIDKMKEHGLKLYEFDGKVVQVTDTSNVKVKAKKKVADDEDGDPDEG